MFKIIFRVARWWNIILTTKLIDSSLKKKLNKKNHWFIFENAICKDKNTYYSSSIQIMIIKY
jgi:hypothetical protein